MHQKTLIVIFISLLSGCAAVSTTQRPDSYYSKSYTAEANQDSLFGTSPAALSDKDISTILSFKLTLASSNRIALLNLSPNRYWNSYSQVFSELNQSLESNFIDKLKNSKRVFDVSFLPSLLVPDTKTVPYLREAAARYQADLLLVYRNQCQSFKKTNFFDPNLSRAYCTVEAILLDTRTGIVPFTALASNSFTAEKNKQDINFNETVRKAELKAIDEDMGEIAERLVQFLAAAPNR